MFFLRADCFSSLSFKILVIALSKSKAGRAGFYGRAGFIERLIFPSGVTSLTRTVTS